MPSTSTAAAPAVTNKAQRGAPRRSSVGSSRSAAFSDSVVVAVARGTAGSTAVGITDGVGPFGGAPCAGSIAVPVADDAGTRAGRGAPLRSASIAAATSLIDPNRSAGDFASRRCRHSSIAGVTLIPSCAMVFGVSVMCAEISSPKPS